MMKFGQREFAYSACPDFGNLSRHQNPLQVLLRLKYRIEVGDNCFGPDVKMKCVPRRLPHGIKRNSSACAT